MKNKNYILIFSLIIILFASFTSYSQTDEKNTALFILRGKVKLNDKAVAGATLELLKDGKQISKFVTTGSGKYTIQVKQSITDPKSEYILSISKEGTVTKSLSINSYVPAEEYIDAPYLFDLELNLIGTALSDIVLERPSGKIKWDSEQNGFAFDQAYAKIVKKENEALETNPEKYLKELEDKKKKEEKIAKQKADEAAKKIADEEAERKADELARKQVEEEEARKLAEAKAKEQEEAERILKQNLEAIKKAMQKNHEQDSIAAFNAKQKTPSQQIQQIKNPVAIADVDPTEFDGTYAFSMNIEKNKMRNAKEKMEKKKAANLATKYETSNTLTSLLDVVDAYDKKMKQ